MSVSRLEVCLSLLSLARVPVLSGGWIGILSAWIIPSISVYVHEMHVPVSLREF